MDRVVLVTGVSSPLAARVAQALSEEPGVRRVVGADSSPPPADARGIEYAHVDLHDGSLDGIVADSGADLVLLLTEWKQYRDLDPTAFGSIGAAALCGGGGQGSAVLLEA